MIGIATAVALCAPLARAEEVVTLAEPVRLELEPSSDCLAETDLRREVESLGTVLREPEAGERSRRLRVRVTEHPGYVIAQLVVTDLVGRESRRMSNVPSCVEAVRSLALFVSLAVEEDGEVPSERSADFVELRPNPAPLPAESPPPVRGRRGGGGVAVVSGYGFHSAEDPMDGVRAFGASRVGRSTRIGVMASFASEEWREDESDRYSTTKGTTYRGAAVFGWGAPWNDTVAGLLGEVGLAGGVQRGATTRKTPCDWGTCVTGDGRSTTRRWMAPYVGASLVLQVPWRFPVRPIAMLTSTATATSAGIVFDSRFDAGLVWQAW